MNWNLGKEAINGKYKSHFLGFLEEKIIQVIPPRVPKFIDHWHFTLSAILWAGVIFIGGFLARQNLNWLWLTNLGILMTWFSDVMDGALGRYRKLGFVKWGYFVD